MGSRELNTHGKGSLQIFSGLKGILILSNYLESRPSFDLQPVEGQL